MIPTNPVPCRDDVLGAFAVEAEPGKATLDRYLRDHPLQAGELIDLSAELAYPVGADTGPLGADEVSRIAAAWRTHIGSRSGGAETEPAAPAADLLAVVYAELRRLAAAKMSRESAAQTLQPTALVHEAWLRLGGAAQPHWQNRAHFFAAAAEAMRRILIDRARKRRAQRHGGGRVRVDAAEIDGVAAFDGNDDHLIAVHEALEKFAVDEPRKAELVKLRYFAGLTLAEAAAALDIPEGTAKRWWTYARAWLYQELRSG